jgi:hypothetical protein
MNPGDRERLDMADASIQPWCSKWVMSRHIGANPSGGFGTDIHSVRSTLAAVGSLHTATYATGSMTRLGVRLKTDDEKLNHKRGVRPLAVNTGGDGAKPR